MHPLRLQWKHLGHVRGAPQLHSYLPSATHGALPYALLLALIYELMTLATRKNRAAIEDRNPTPASRLWAAKPSSRPSEVALRPLNQNGILNVLPRVLVQTTSIRQNYAASFFSHTDRRHHFTLVRPFPAKRRS